MKILTFDVEDWFHILDNDETRDVDAWRTFPSRIESGVERILNYCDRAQQTATFFILGWMAEVAPGVMAEIARRGHEIGCHSYRHQLVYSQTPQEFEGDLRRALDHIEAATGARPRSYRAPGFSITPDCLWAFDILAASGIEVDASVFPAPRAHGGLPGFPEGRPCRLETLSGREMRMFPMSYGTVLGRRLVFSGGGYFRLLPYPALRRGFAGSDYVMTYFHPRDFDPEQPMVPGLSRARRFKSYVGLAGALGKLERLTAEDGFVSMGQAEAAIDWADTPRVACSDVAETAKTKESAHV